MEIIVWLGLGIVVGYFADKKGRNAVGWGLLALLISPIIAGIALAIAKDLTVEKSIENLNSRADNIKLEMNYNQKYNDLRSDNIEKEVNRISSGYQPQKELHNPIRDTNLLSNSPDKNSLLIADELNKLYELKKAGVLTDSEFDMQKKRILGY